MTYYQGHLRASRRNTTLYMISVA